MTWLRALIAIVLAFAILAIAGCLYYGIGDDEPADPDDVVGLVG
jgi:hypothetical protein